MEKVSFFLLRCEREEKKNQHFFYNSIKPIQIFFGAPASIFLVFFLGEQGIFEFVFCNYYNRLGFNKNGMEKYICRQFFCEIPYGLYSTRQETVTLLPSGQTGV